MKFRDSVHEKGVGLVTDLVQSITEITGISRRRADRANGKSTTYMRLVADAVTIDNMNNATLNSTEMPSTSDVQRQVDAFSSLIDAIVELLDIKKNLQISSLEDPSNAHMLKEDINFLVHQQLAILEATIDDFPEAQKKKFQEDLHQKAQAYNKAWTEDHPGFSERFNNDPEIQAALQHASRVSASHILNTDAQTTADGFLALTERIQQDLAENASLGQQVEDLRDLHVIISQAPKQLREDAMTIATRLIAILGEELSTVPGLLSNEYKSDTLNISQGIAVSKQSRARQT